MCAHTHCNTQAVYNKLLVNVPALIYSEQLALFIFCPTVYIMECTGYSLGEGVLTPLVLLSNLLLFLRSEVVLDVECLANLLRSFPYMMVSQSKLLWTLTACECMPGRQ